MERSLNVLGAFDRISADTLPYPMRLKYMLAWVRYKPSENGAHHAILSLVNADGNTLLGVEFSSEVKCDEDSGPFTSAYYYTCIFDVPLAEYGDYAVNLSIDGNHVASAPLFFRPRLGGQPLL